MEVGLPEGLHTPAPRYSFCRPPFFAGHISGMPAPRWRPPGGPFPLVPLAWHREVLRGCPENRQPQA